MENNILQIVKQIETENEFYIRLCDKALSFELAYGRWTEYHNTCNIIIMLYMFIEHDKICTKYKNS